MNDMISRQAAIDSIRECAEAAHSNHEWDMEQGYLNAIECIEEEPSAEPKNKRGECQYIVSKGTYSGTKNYKCTKCGDSFSWTQNEFYPWRFNYCRNCGAKVVGCIEAEADHE